MAESYARSIFIQSFWKNLTVFSRVPVTKSHSQDLVGRSSLLHPVSEFTVCRCFADSHPAWGVWVPPRCGSHLSSLEHHIFFRRYCFKLYELNLHFEAGFLKVDLVLTFFSHDLPQGISWGQVSFAAPAALLKSVHKPVCFKAVVKRTGHKEAALLHTRVWLPGQPEPQKCQGERNVPEETPSACVSFLLP